MIPKVTWSLEHLLEENLRRFDTRFLESYSFFYLPCSVSLLHTRITWTELIENRTRGMGKMGDYCWREVSQSQYHPEDMTASTHTYNRKPTRK
jgi:hypothetical protein